MESLVRILWSANAPSLIVVISALAGSACTGVEPTVPQEDHRDRFPITVRVHYAPMIFGSYQTPTPPNRLIEPYAEGLLLISDPPRPYPRAWQTTQDTATDTRSSMTPAVHWPVILHPDMVATVTQRLQLPAYVCVALKAFPRHVLAESMLANALSSNCVPVPREFETLSLAQAAELLDERPEIYNPIDVTVDTISSSEAVNDTLGRFLFGLFPEGQQ